jgi:uncharacterized membrane protein
MSYHEKKALVSIFTSLLITGSFSVYLYQRYAAEGLALIQNPQFWGSSYLWLIGLSILGTILITIVFTIHYRITARENEPAITDERDQLIELKAARVSYYVFALGFVLAMTLLALSMPLHVMFITILYSGFMSSIVDDAIQFYLYRRGF